MLILSIHHVSSGLLGGPSVYALEIEPWRIQGVSDKEACQNPGKLWLCGCDVLHGKGKLTEAHSQLLCCAFQSFSERTGCYLLGISFSSQSASAFLLESKA